MEGAAITAGVTVVGAGLFSIGIPKDSIVRYETAIKTGSYVLIAHGTAADVTHAQDVIGRTNPITTDQHAPTD
jgi:hypothetical protein